MERSFFVKRKRVVSLRLANLASNTILMSLALWIINRGSSMPEIKAMSVCMLFPRGVCFANRPKRCICHAMTSSKDTLSFQGLESHLKLAYITVSQFISESIMSSRQDQRGSRPAPSKSYSRSKPSVKSKKRCLKSILRTLWTLTSVTSRALTLVRITRYIAGLA